MGKVRLRTKFLLSLLAISAGLTAATLLIVSYSVRKQVRQSIREELSNSVKIYQSSQKQREEALTRSGTLIANLPSVRALMTTDDDATIQDASADVWRLGGNDLLVLANRMGNVKALRTSSAGLTREAAQDILRRSLDREESRDWWFGGGHLYEVWIQPIVLGSASQSTTVGLLAVGHEINDRAARDFGSIASSEVAFNFGDITVASTLDAAQQKDLARQVHQTGKLRSGKRKRFSLDLSAILPRL